MDSEHMTPTLPKKRSKFVLSCCKALLASLLFASLAHANPLPLWKLSETDNNVYLMGSIHFLREQDYPLAATIMTAYDESNVVIMEIDMDNLDPMKSMIAMESKGALPGGQSLQNALGNEDYAEAERKAQELGMSLTLFAGKKPWYAGLLITQLRLMQLGFDPTWGIEQQFTQL
ncbi:MAG: TraB/GumN family protein, partial [Gammaproteobacteria bacterium]